MITIDYGNTNIITIPLTSLTLISGTIYQLDTNSFRLELKTLEASEEGIVFPDTNIHNTEVTVAGTTFARTIEIIVPYSVEFEDGQYTVVLQGSNNNIFDVLNGILVQNQVQVVPTNSAGLIVVTTGSGLSIDQDTKLNEIFDRLPSDGEEIAGENDVSGGGSSVWTESEKNKVIEDSEAAKNQAAIAALNTQTSC